MSRTSFLFIDWRLFVAWVLVLAASCVGADETGLHEATFSLYAPQAKSVEIIGDFNQWQSGATPLTGPDKSGWWRTTLKFPGTWSRIEYIYWVDHAYRQIDSAQPIVADGFSGDNNVIVLP